MPEVGNLVRLRGGMWVVSGVAPAAHLRNGDHLVKAVSIDGPDQVEVIWEVEPATQVIQRLAALYLAFPIFGFLTESNSESPDHSAAVVAVIVCVAVAAYLWRWVPRHLRARR